MATTRKVLSRSQLKSRRLRDKMAMSTAEIGLSVRTTNCLEERGILTVEDLLNRTPEHLLSISNFGGKTLEEVYLALEGIGFYRSSREHVQRKKQEEELAAKVVLIGSR